MMLVMHVVKETYVALSGECVDDVIKPELRAEYERETFAWFPQDYNDEGSAFDKRTPGLFKTGRRNYWASMNQKLNSAVRG